MVTNKICLSAPLKPNAKFAEILVKKLKDTKNSNNPINNRKEKITYFRDGNYKSKKRYEKGDVSCTKTELVGTIIDNATTSSSVTLSATWFDLIVEPISTGNTAELTLNKKVLFEIIKNNFSK